MICLTRENNNFCARRHCIYAQTAVQYGFQQSDSNQTRRDPYELTRNNIVITE